MRGRKQWRKQVERVGRKYVTLFSNQTFNLLEGGMHGWEEPEMTMSDQASGRNGEGCHEVCKRAERLCLNVGDLKASGAADG